MKKDQLEALKAKCGAILTINGLKPASKSGARAIYFFWQGALSALGDDATNAYVIICLATGRHVELATLPAQEAQPQV